MNNKKRGSEWSKWDLHIHSPASFFWSGGKQLKDMDPLEKETELDKFIKQVNESDVDVFCLMDYWTFDWCIEIINRKKTIPDSIKKTIFYGMELRIDCPVNYRLNIHVLLSDDLTEQNLLDFKSELLINIGTTTKKLSNSSLIELAKSYDKSKSATYGYGDPSTLSDMELLELGSKTARITRESLKKAMKGLPKNSGYVLLPYDTSDGLIDLDWSQHPQEDNYFMQTANIFESRKDESINLFNGIKNSVNENYFDNFFKTLGGISKPCISGSDAHKYIDYGIYPSNRITWIKANPTFEGLKQIIYVPRDRVRVQRTNPELEKKHWKLEEVTISESTISLLPNQTIELNSGLNSIIGGRGTGKSGLLSLISSFNGEEDNFLRYIKTKGDFKVSISLKNKEGGVENFEGTLSEGYNFSLPIYYLSQNEIEQFSKEDEKEKYRRKFLSVIGIENNDYYYNEGKIKAESLISKLRQIDIEEEKILDSITQISQQKNITLDVSFPSDDKINSLIDFLKKEKEKYSTGETKTALENISSLTTKGNKLNLLIESNLVDKIKQTAFSLNELIKQYNASFQKNEFDDSFKQHIESLGEYDISIGSDFSKQTQENKNKVIAYRDSLRKDCTPHIKTLKDNGVKDFQNITDAIEQIDKLLIKLGNHKSRLKDIKDERNGIYVGLIQVLDGYKSSITNAQKDIEEKFKNFTENKDELFNNIFDGVLVSPHTYFNLEVLHYDLADCFYRGKFECISSYTDSFNENYESFFDNIKKDFLEDIAMKKHHFKENNDGYYKLLKVIFQECMNIYITVHPKIQLGGRELGSMSGGQQATLMLKLKLASEGLSKDIIILDQPENHLDNMFIKDSLVKLIKDLKKEKQVIIASHNANLVVGADSEEIIIAQMDEISKEYFSGAIENKEIQSLLIDTLEGGEDAFKKRQERYDY